MRNFDGHVDSVEERARNALLVKMYLAWCAFARLLIRAVITARARIGGCEEQKIARIFGCSAHAAKSNRFILEWLAESFKDVFSEFWKFIEEEDSVRGERDFARPEERAAAKDAGARGAIVRRAEGSTGSKIVSWAKKTIEPRNGNALPKAEWW